ncbi:hypothetical protein ACFXKC_40820 [Streptomyces sp. NPDC059340]|uniref:hypothetical protein n=1 Tax=Streptomyces sp. NPDC059340 TaxID=3346806 RepID=UPI00368FD9FD
MPEGFEEFRKSGSRRCWGYSKKTQSQCGQAAMPGQNVCKFHGGAAPQSLRAAEQRIAEEKARVLVQTYGRKIETTATAALLDEVQWTAGHVAWLRERVHEIESVAAVAGTDREHPLVWGVTREKSGGEDHGTTEEAAPNVWLKLYQQERTHLVKVCEAAIRAGIEERRVRLAEEQGALVAQVIRLILADLNLSAEQRQLVPQIVPRHLRALGA